MATMRTYTGPDDLRAMQRLTQRLWSHASGLHVGDLAWRRNMHVGIQWPTALWEENGEVVAWGWVEPPGELNFQVDPARPELADAVLEWHSDVDERGTAIVLETETHLAEALERNGYEPKESVFRYVHMSRGLDGDDLPEPVLPEGFRVRPVGPEDLARRVAVHRAAWHPSNVTEESHRQVMRAWPYRSDLDWVAEAPDGTFAASCLIWLDERNGVGLLEPVGADPRFRRRGLTRAVCLGALHALRDAGAREAVVVPVEGHELSVASLPLYRGLGFEPRARDRFYTSP